jgi:acylphosphatase
METARIRLVVRGVVQGVGFRYFVLRSARESGLRGFVKNLRDGSVEVVAEGGRDTLERFARDVTLGPGHAQVRDIELQWSEPSGEFDSFEVNF